MSRPARGTPDLVRQAAGGDVSNRGPTLDYRPSGPAQPPDRRHPVVAWAIGLACAAPVVLCTLLSLDLHRAYRLDRKMIDVSTRAEAARSKAAGDPRFAGLTFWPTTRDGGVLLVQGAVATSADLAAIQQVVRSTGPAEDVRWEVSVGPIPATAPAAAGGP